MQISLSDAGKRYNRDWIFRKLSFEFSTRRSYAIVGPNGSGKSTLLQIIGGAVTPSEGSITYKSGSTPIVPDEIFRRIVIAAPYLELVEEMTLIEFLKFHCKFKPFLSGFDVKKIISEVSLEGAATKQIRYYSSGMKQRVKLAQAFFSDADCLLLDEPCTNLDVEGINLYHRLVETYGRGRLIIVSSNDEQEYCFCEERIDMRKWKT